MKEVVIYTDGACSGNPGPGGWAAVLQFGQFEKVLQGAEDQTTNNRMELMAAIEGLNALKEPCKVFLHSDSNYVVKAFTDRWLDNWVKRGWVKADKKPVENQDLWKQLLSAAQRHQVSWIKVKGHADNELNNRADELAVAAMNANRTDR